MIRWIFGSCASSGDGRCASATIVAATAGTAAAAAAAAAAAVTRKLTTVTRTFTRSSSGWSICTFFVMRTVVNP